MSMFHELMMKNKTKIMYATIKGSLTESPDGVFSGFTSANYLSLDCGTNTIDNWEMSIDFVFPTSPSQSYNALISRVSPGFQIFNKTSGSGLQIEINGSEQIITFLDLVRGNNYNINIKYNAGSWVAVLTNKDTSATSTKTATTSNVWLLSGKFRFGLTQSGNYGWDDTINLNTSYLKIGSTKYNLQAVVGYTVVGSPTITDGVASGFSNSNYLKIQNIPTYTQDDRVEFVFNFTCETLYQSVLCGGAGTFFVPYINNSGKIIYYGSTIGLAGQAGANTLVANQNYYFKAIYDTTSFKAYISTDGINWILDYSKNVSATFSKSGDFEIGRNTAASNQYLRGRIYLNNTYIKVNNKLWFNGQQA